MAQTVSSLEGTILSIIGRRFDLEHPAVADDVDGVCQMPVR